MLWEQRPGVGTQGLLAGAHLTSAATDKFQEVLQKQKQRKLKMQKSHIPEETSQGTSIRQGALGLTKIDEWANLTPHGSLLWSIRQPRRALQLQHS